MAASSACRLLSGWLSFVGDYVLRQKIYGPALTKAIAYQLPAPDENHVKAYGGNCVTKLFIESRVMELTYTAWDLEAFAQDCDWPGPPFRWDEERRFLLRCELDAAFFHLYLDSETEWKQQPEALTRAFPKPRDAVGYIMDTFPIVKRKDEAKHGTYRTKDTIMDIYDSLAEAIATGSPYKTLLDPPPASFRVAHPPRLPAIPRVPLTQARIYWIEFIGTASRLAGEEFTFDFLWAAYLTLLDRATHADEAAAVLGADAEVWLNSVKTEPLTAGVFPDLLESLNADGFLAVDPERGLLRLSPEVPYTPDPWRCYDVAAVLSLLQARPKALEFPNSTAASQRDQTHYESLAKRFA